VFRPETKDAVRLEKVTVSYDSLNIASKSSLLVMDAENDLAAIGVL
jgi:hypothetical protein